MRKIAGLIISVICALVIGTGDVSAVESGEILLAARQSGLNKPFVYTWSSEATAVNLLAGLRRTLRSSGARFLVSDSKIGLLSWADLGSAFVPMPTHIKKRQQSSALKFTPPVGVWRGKVYATARVLPSRDSTVVYLHAVAWLPDDGKLLFSNGAFERNIVRRVRTQLNRESIQQKNLEVKAKNGGSLSVGRPARGYSDLFRTQFRNLPEIPAVAVREHGVAEIYPAQLTVVWGAAIDLLSQFDLVARIDSDDRVIIFGKIIALPESSAAYQNVNVPVLLAFSVKARGSEGSMAHVALLSPNELRLVKVPDIRRKDDVEVKKLLATQQGQAAAALVISEFFNQLATQLFHEERWRTTWMER